MDQSFQSGLDFDECAEVHEARDVAGDALAGEVALGRGGPWIGFELLETERNFLRLGFDFEDAQRELLADGENIFRLGDAGTRDVADVEKAVDAADVNKCAVGHEGADSAGDGVTGLERGAADFAFAAGLFLEDDAAIDDDVLIGDVELGDAAVDLLADEGLK